MAFNITFLIGVILLFVYKGVDSINCPGVNRGISDELVFQTNANNVN